MGAIREKWKEAARRWRQRHDAAMGRRVVLHIDDMPRMDTMIRHLRDSIEEAQEIRDERGAGTDEWHRMEAVINRMLDALRRLEGIRTRMGGM